MVCKETGSTRKAGFSGTYRKANSVELDIQTKLIKKSIDSSHWRITNARVGAFHSPMEGPNEYCRRIWNWNRERSILVLLLSLSSMQSGDQVMNDWMHPFLALLIFSGVDLEPIMKYLWNCGGPTQRILYLISLRALLMQETDNRIDTAEGIQVLQNVFGSYLPPYSLAKQHERKRQNCNLNII